MEQHVSKAYGIIHMDLSSCIEA